LPVPAAHSANAFPVALRDRTRLPSFFQHS
jgi:hypothetical protein